MKDLSVELSPRVKQSRYISLVRKPMSDAVFYAGYETCLPNFSIDREEFPFWTIEYISEGNGEIQIGGKRHKLQTGSVICYGPGVPLHFHNYPDHPFHKYFICRTDEDFPEGWKAAGLKPGAVLTISASIPFAEVIGKLLSEGERYAAKKPEMLSAIESIMLTYVHSAHHVDNTKKNSASRAYALAVDVLLREFRELGSLAQLSERTGYGPEYLCRVFRRFHSESPYQALLRLKMYEAFRLLKEGQLRIADIATAIGFSDPLHFSRVFRKVMGFPPSLIDKH